MKTKHLQTYRKKCLIVDLGLHLGKLEKKMENPKTCVAHPIHEKGNVLWGRKVNRLFVLYSVLQKIILGQLGHIISNMCIYHQAIYSINMTAIHLPYM